MASTSEGPSSNPRTKIELPTSTLPVELEEFHQSLRLTSLVRNLNLNLNLHHNPPSASTPTLISSSQNWRSTLTTALKSPRIPRGSSESRTTPPSTPRPPSPHSWTRREPLQHLFLFENLLVLDDSRSMCDNLKMDDPVRLLDNFYGVRTGTDPDPDIDPHPGLGLEQKQGQGSVVSDLVDSEDNSGSSSALFQIEGNLDHEGTENAVKVEVEDGDTDEDGDHSDVEDQGNVKLLTRWDQLKHAVSKLVDESVEYDHDGFRAHFLNNCHKDPAQLVKTSEDFDKLFWNVQPRGQSFTGLELYELFKAYLQSFASASIPVADVQPGEHTEPVVVKPINFIILTDGEPTHDLEGFDLKSVIVDFAAALKMMTNPVALSGTGTGTGTTTALAVAEAMTTTDNTDVNTNTDISLGGLCPLDGQVSIQFVLVGNSYKGRCNLNKLDQELRWSNLEGLVDIHPHEMLFDTDLVAVLRRMIDRRISSVAKAEAEAARNQSLTRSRSRSSLSSSSSSSLASRRLGFRDGFHLDPRVSPITPSKSTPMLAQSSRSPMSVSVSNSSSNPSSPSAGRSRSWSTFSGQGQGQGHSSSPSPSPSPSPRSSGGTFSRQDIGTSTGTNSRWTGKKVVEMLPLEDGTEFGDVLNV